MSLQNRLPDVCFLASPCHWCLWYSSLSEEFIELIRQMRVGISADAWPSALGLGCPVSESVCGSTSGVYDDSRILRRRQVKLNFALLVESLL